jgi:hypothetical protein
MLELSAFWRPCQSLDRTLAHFRVRVVQAFRFRVRIEHKADKRQIRLEWWPLFLTSLTLAPGHLGALRQLLHLLSTCPPDRRRDCVGRSKKPDRTSKLRSSGAFRCQWCPMQSDIHCPSFRGSPGDEIFPSDTGGSDGALVLDRGSGEFCDMPAELLSSAWKFRVAAGSLRRWAALIALTVGEDPTVSSSS